MTNEAAAELTICTVSFNSAGFIRRNIDLTSSLNLGVDVPWIVVENSPTGVDETQYPRSSCKLIPGPFPDRTHPRSPSHHHGVALNRAMKEVRTRYAVVLDPDFYIVRPNWVADVLHRVRSRGLTLFAAPWHPRWSYKYRYAPSPHCLVLDLSVQSLSNLDFTPRRKNFEDEYLWKALASARSQLQNSSFPLPRRVRQGLTVVSGDLIGRLSIGRSDDTGYRLRDIVRSDPTTCELLVPVLRNENSGAGVPRTRWSLLLDQILPDALSYWPKRKGYTDSAGFREHGAFDASGLGWEEFLWQGEPFAFHLRRFGRGAIEDARDLRSLEEALTSFVQGSATRSSRRTAAATSV